MESEKIVILEFITKKIYILDYDSNIYHNVEDFFLTEEFIESSITINSCEYMIVNSNDLRILFGL